MHGSQTAPKFGTCSQHQDQQQTLGLRDTTLHVAETNCGALHTLRTRTFGLLYVLVIRLRSTEDQIALSPL